MSETFGGWNAGDSIPDVEYNGSQAGSVYQNPDAKLIRRAELEIRLIANSLFFIVILPFYVYPPDQNAL